jgi:hypothetical protein
VTGQEAALLWALDSCPAATPRQLAALLSERAGRVIPWQVIGVPALRLADRGLVTRERDEHGHVRYQLTQAGRDRAAVFAREPRASDFTTMAAGAAPDDPHAFLAASRPAPPDSAPAARPDRRRPPGRMWTVIEPGQVWLAPPRNPQSGRRVQVLHSDEELGRVSYRVLSPADGATRWSAYGRMSATSLRTTYVLQDAPALRAGDQLAVAPPGGDVHLMITDPGEPDHDDVFARCCGYNWRALLEHGDLITGRRELVTCPGRPVAR